MIYSARRIFTVLCLSSLIFLSSITAEIPLLSSKAVRISLKAKDAIEGHDEKALKSAVDELQSLLRESSFRRLDPQAQVHILLLLSKGFERLERYKDQEQLLLSYAKREELYRFQVPLKTALAKSFTQQHRLVEAEKILSKIIKSSCAHLSLEEKGAIATVLTFKDEYLSNLLRQGDKLAEQGKWEEALKLYEIVYFPLNRQEFPYQASTVEKKRIRQKLTLRMAEAQYCLGKFQEAIDIVHEWDESLFFAPLDQPLLTRRLFVIASSYQKLGNTEAASTWFHTYLSSPYVKRPFLDRHIWSSPLQSTVTGTQDLALSPHFLLWMAEEALQGSSPAQFSQTYTFLQSKIKTGEGILHIINGFRACLDHNLPLSVQELALGLTNRSFSLGSAWREASFHLLAECIFERMMLLTCSNQQKEAEEEGKKYISMLSPGLHPNTLLRVGFIRLFLYKVTHDTSHLLALQELLTKISSSVVRYNQSLLALLVDLTSYLQGPAQRDSQGENIFECARSIKGTLASEGICYTAESLSTADRFFATWIGMADMLSSPFEQCSESNENIESPFSRYLAAIALYQQAMADEISVSQATPFLYSCLDAPGYWDVRPQLIHCLIDLSLHSQQLVEANTLVHRLIKEHPAYLNLPQAVLSCIFAFGGETIRSSDTILLCRYIFDRPKVDIHTLTLIVHLFENPLLLEHKPCVSEPDQVLTPENSFYSDTSKPLDSSNLSRSPHERNFQELELALKARAEARNLVGEALKAKEPSAIKERVQTAKRSFDAARMQALKSLPSIHDPKAISFIWGLIFQVQNELIDLLERYITSDSAFNELPCLLEDASLALRQDLCDCKAMIPQCEEYISASFLQSCACLSLTSEIFAKTFRRELDGALLSTKELTTEWISSRSTIRAFLFLAKTLRESSRPQEALDLLKRFREAEQTQDVELALEIAMEKSLCLRELHQPDKAKALLAWVINGPYASSLRVKAMILRADLYLSLHRTDLAIRQLESVSAKGGEWGAVADRKLRELYGTE
jgi:tetratricopeptide (TPR) repeat protein